MQLFIQHQQLNIRRFVATDKQGFIGLVQNPLCMKYSITGVLTEQQASECFDKLINSEKHKMYAIEDVKNKVVIGCTGLQDCYVDLQIEPSFILRLLPDFNDHQDLLPLLQQLVDQLPDLYKLSHLQAVVSQKNKFNMQLMTELNFEQKKSITCRGIASYLYQSC